MTRWVVNGTGALRGRRPPPPAGGMLLDPALRRSEAPGDQAGVAEEGRFQGPDGPIVTYRE